MGATCVEYEVKMLTLDGGRCPFEEWFGAIRDKPTSARIRSRITRLRAGNFGDGKSVGAGVSELRLDFGPGYRVYFAIVGQRIVVLLAGGDKSTQDRDIAQARQMWEQNKDATERLQRDF